GACRRHREGLWTEFGTAPLILLIYMGSPGSERKPARRASVVSDGFEESVAVQRQLALPHAVNLAHFHVGRRAPLRHVDERLVGKDHKRGNALLPGKLAAQSLELYKELAFRIVQPACARGVGAGAFAARRLFRAAQGYRFPSQQDGLSLLGELETAILLAGGLQSLAREKLAVDGAPL